MLKKNELFVDPQMDPPPVYVEPPVAVSYVPIMDLNMIKELGERKDFEIKRLNDVIKEKEIKNNTFKTLFFPPVLATRGELGRTGIH